MGGHIGCRPLRGGGGGTWLWFGWVCASRVSKFGPRFKKKMLWKWYPVLEIGYFLLPRHDRLCSINLVLSNAFYKITKIVRALLLAERSVCMWVCKHGCGVMLFCFSRANHASTNLKKVSSSKPDKFTLFTHSFVGWNFENRYKESVSIFFRLSWHFKWEKSVFWKAPFCKLRTDYACKTS